MKIDKIPLHASFDVEGDEAGRARARRSASSRARGWQIRKREFGGEEWSFVDKHNWARRGVLVAHVGFVIIAAGTTIYWATGYSGQFSRPLGHRPATIPQTGAHVALKQFGLPDPTGRHQERDRLPADRLRLDARSSPGKTASPHDAVIRVNQPYDVDGVKIYQATYGFGITFALTHRRPADRRSARHAAQGRRSVSDIPGTGARDRVPAVRRHDRPPHRPAARRPAAQRSGRRHRGLRRRPAARPGADPARASRSISARASR